MTEEVAPEATPPSEPPEATTEEVVAQDASTETETEATLKKRLAGKDSALTRTIRERDEALTRTRELEDWKAQQERGSLTEVERLRLELEDKDRKLVEAQETARAAKLEARYPNAYAAADGKLTDETALAKLEATLTRDNGATAPTVPNSAPKRPSEPIKTEKTSADLEAELRALPNPFTGL